MILVVPMAGRGSRFAGSRWSAPKPLITVRERPMVGWALEGLSDIAFTRRIFISLQEHERDHGVSSVLRRLASDCEIVLLNDVTDGQLCTVLAARHLIPPEEDILIASADTYVHSDIGTDINNKSADCAGMISVARLFGDSWSFARLDARSRVVEVAEKRRISPWASTGLYYFSKAADLFRIADTMIAQKEKTNGEYFLIPVYQHLIREGKAIDISHAKNVHDLGNPEALERFIISAATPPP